MKDETTMSATPMIHQLVVDGRLRPDQGAMLLEMGRDIQSEQARQARGRLATIGVTLVLFVLAMFGFRRSSQA